MGEVEDQFYLFIFFFWDILLVGGGGGGVCEKLQANKQMPFHKIIFWEKSDFFLGHPTGGGLVG